MNELAVAFLAGFGGGMLGSLVVAALAFYKIKEDGLGTMPGTMGEMEDEDIPNPFEMMNEMAENMGGNNDE